MKTTDPPNFEPAQRWIALALDAHETMHKLTDDAINETRKRKECIQMALAMGATQQQVAKALGISREMVAKLSR